MKVDGIIITTLVEFAVVDIPDTVGPEDHDLIAKHFQAQAVLAPKTLITEHVQFLSLGEKI